MSTRADIVSIADGLIRSRGYNAFSYATIGAQLDIRTAAIHYYFPSKSDLGAAVIDEELRGLREYREKNAGVTGSEQLQHLFGGFLRGSKRRYICLMGSL